MFDPGAADVVGAAILELLRHDEQGNASRARGRALHPGKNQVDDIVAPVMLAIAGKDLAAGDPEAAVRLLNRLRRDQRQVGARLWLGETHAGRPPTRRKIWDVDRKSTRLELQSLMRISYAVFCLKKKKKQNIHSITSLTK